MMMPKDLFDRLVGPHERQITAALRQCPDSGLKWWDFEGLPFFMRCEEQGERIYLYRFYARSNAWKLTVKVSYQKITPGMRWEKGYSSPIQSYERRMVNQTDFCGSKDRFDEDLILTILSV